MMLPYHHSKSVLVFDKSLFNKCQLSRVCNWSILPYFKRTILRYSSLSILCSFIKIKVIFVISDLCWFLIQTFIMQTPDTHTHMTHTYTHTQVVITHKHPHYIHTHTHTPWCDTHTQRNPNHKHTHRETLITNTHTYPHHRHTHLPS